MNNKDIQILRELARKKSEIAHQEVQKENAKLWTDINDRKKTRPTVFIDEIPWHEMNVNDELTLQAEDPFMRRIELNLRRELYSWKYMPGTMIIDNVIKSPIVFTDTGFGITENVDIAKTDENNTVVSRHFNIQINSEEDIHKIKNPVVSVDLQKTEENFNILSSIFDNILEVEKTGVKGLWFTPWDNIVRWTGVQEALIDLALEPKYIEKLVERFVDASIIRLEQYEKLGLWASNNDNTRVGSGGYGYTNTLEAAASLNSNAPLKQLWGCGNAQIFSNVSPDMHWEFSLKHEMRWLEKFGLTYYGCCEPLHNKFHILDRIPNLRKISISPWADLDITREVAKDKYVLSVKPSPSIFAFEKWDPELARSELRTILEKTKGCSVEIILKDISTVSYEPQRLWEWARITDEEIKEFYF